MSAEAPLLPLLRAIIRDEGPIGLDRFMTLALGHPAHGYYMTRDPFGAGGDFVTAPEVSQMFGEMIGLWCATVFEAMGAPERVSLVELGPGRGTLMADLLRAARVAPAFRAAATVHLVETSQFLRDRQRETLAGTEVSPQWHASIDTLPAGPLLVIANEFFDALPVRHYLRADDGWHERLVGLDSQDALVFGVATEHEPALTLRAPAGAILETGIVGQALMRRLADRLVADGGAALVIDYGYTAPRFGESLQAVRSHRFVDPLSKPGEADLTTHVDFAALGRASAEAGAQHHGPMPQGAFLRMLGIAARAERLAAMRADQAQTVRHALERLTGAAPGMGELFKVLAVTAPGFPAPPGFDAALAV